MMTDCISATRASNRLIWMTYSMRVDPARSPTVACSTAEITELKRVAATQTPARTAGPVFTFRRAVRTMAKIGGFLDRKNQSVALGEDLSAWLEYYDIINMVSRKGICGDNVEPFSIESGEAVMPMRLDEDLHQFLRGPDAVRVPVLTAKAKCF